MEEEFKIVLEEEEVLQIELDNDVILEKDYNRLENRPSINDVTLEGNKTSEELNLQEKRRICKFSYN